MPFIPEKSADCGSNASDIPRPARVSANLNSDSISKDGMESLMRTGLSCFEIR